ncbi:MAG: molybdopterin converting factor subunit 1 [Saprospiraceae bacterium]|nr:molybdopterin converting factor subunit 1 [Saprospiraceae bacterium]
MKIKILAFGIAKDILGARTMELDMAESTSVALLKAHLIEQHPQFSKLRSLALAINQEYVDDNQIISENDEVVIIPPVSGG